MEKIALNEKYLLSLSEASVYFGVGIKRMRSIAESNEGNFTVRLGRKYLVIRSRAEAWLNGDEEIYYFDNGSGKTESVPLRLTSVSRYFLPFLT